MAKVEILGLFAAALVTVWAGQTFLAPGATTGPLTSPPSSASLRGAVPGADASPALSIAAAAVFAASAAMAASAVRSRNASKMSRKAGGWLPTPYKEPEFAQGLIGGQSAFGGDYNFDPLGLAAKFPADVPWFREAEIKHGRVCMLAWIGLVAPDVFGHIPGQPECYGDDITVLKAHNACVFANVMVAEGAPQIVKDSGGLVVGQPTGPMVQLLLWIGIFELATTYSKIMRVGEQFDFKCFSIESAGDYGLGKNFLPQDEAGIKRRKLSELKNGRLAMLAFSGAITQAMITGNGFPWLFAESGSQAPGLSASVTKAKVPATMAGTRGSRVARRAGETGGYKMSKAVPFLPVSPALEGYAGEEDGFDPMGFTLAINVQWLREAELKHARIAMLATLGWITTDLGVRVPGDLFQVSTLEAHDVAVQSGSFPQLFVWAGYFEMFGYLAIVNMLEGTTARKPGDFGLRALYPADEQGQYDMQMRELRNGRLAMLAFSGIVTVGVLTGKTWPFLAAQAPRNALALRAYPGGPVYTDAEEPPRPLSRSLPFLPAPKNLEGMIGAEPQFDPLGFSDYLDVRWLREAELKHGRVTMLACVGFVAQQWIAFPGVKLCPNALDAVYVAPASLTAALIFLAGWVESETYDGKITLTDMFSEGAPAATRSAGDFNFGAGFLKGKSDEEVVDMKLKELNNGRLAMLAFSGMVHHNIIVSGPMFPIFPDNWAGPQYTWKVDSFMAHTQGMIAP